MRINSLTVCVSYADFLKVGIERWKAGLDSLIVVTGMDDRETVELCEAHGVECLRTDLFYRDGAAFNKGRAMEWARLQMPWEDWILFFDADIVPEDGWRQLVERFDPQPGNLYSAFRFQCNDQAMIGSKELPRLNDNGVGAGYFHLFHVSDPALQPMPPLIETQWLHAGNYDSKFMDRWRTAGRRKMLPIRLDHLGDLGNWFGRGKHEEYRAMQVERRRRGGRWDHERIGVSRESD